MAGLAHLGVGFAAKRVAPEVPLGVLLPAAMGLDILSILLSLIGIESQGNTPWSHGMLMSLIISAAVFGFTLMISKKIRIAVVVGLVVFSHWILDLLTWPLKILYANAEGVPVLFDNSIRIGLGIESNIVTAIIFEVLVTGAGILIYIFTIKKMCEEKQLFKNAQKLQEGMQ